MHDLPRMLARTIRDSARSRARASRRRRDRPRMAPRHVVVLDAAPQGVGHEVDSVKVVGEAGPVGLSRARSAAARDRTVEAGARRTAHPLASTRFPLSLIRQRAGDVVVLEREPSGSITSVARACTLGFARCISMRSRTVQAATVLSDALRSLRGRARPAAEAAGGAAEQHLHDPLARAAPVRYGWRGKSSVSTLP